MIMKIEDLIPEKPSFKLDNGKEYTLRIPNLEDKVEMVRLCGGADNIQNVFGKNKDWATICKIVYRLMIDKSDFLATKQKRINDEGFEEEVIVTGPIMLLRALSTQREAMEMLQAFNAASVASEPLLREVVDDEIKKKAHLFQLIGEKSSSSAPVNTGTPPSSSGNLPPESLI